ncbi:MAG: radical SAM/SPASM domain-containing protein [Promethearchaeota archaeon]
MKAILRDYEGYYLDAEMQHYYYDRKLYSLQLEVTSFCDQGCYFCYTRGSKSAREMPANFVRSILDSAAAMAVRKIDWLGGDPLKKSDWYELMIYSNDLGFINNIWTTGNLLSDPVIAEKAVAVTEGGLISVHFDTFSPTLYERLHRVPPSFVDQILQGLRNVINLGKPPEELYHCITFTKLQAGSDFQQTVDRLLDELDIPTGIVPYKPALPDYDYLIPSSEEIREALEYKNKRCLGVDIPIIPQCVSKFYCGTTAALINGDALSLCSRIRHVVARLENHTFCDVFNDHRHSLLKIPLRTLTNLPQICQSCELNTICFGCRSNAWYYAYDFLARDPKCWKMGRSEETVECEEV